MKRGKLPVRSDGPPTFGEELTMNASLRLASLTLLIPLVACGSDANTTQPRGFEPTEVGVFDRPWAMTFLPDGRLLITEKGGALKLRATDGSVGEITGVPSPKVAGQGGLGDIVLHPDYADNSLVYLSWVEAGAGDTSGAAVGRATLSLDSQGGGALDGLEVIWRQEPKVTGNGHFSHRIAFAPDGHLFITSGERQQMSPAQDMTVNLGKIVRLNEDGSVPDDNPFADQGGVTAQIWSLGHRNPLGIAFAADGTLWEHEMGPQGGDELNVILPGKNYGWPEVSEGEHYDGTPIPSHDTRPELEAPRESWVPVISPSSLVIYSGDVFPAWRGDGFIGGLSSEALIRVDLENGEEAERWPMGERIRAVAQSPDGHIYVAEDGEGGRLLQLTPVD